jgi:hypothetical protein
MDYQTTFFSSYGTTGIVIAIIRTANEVNFQTISTGLKTETIRQLDWVAQL